MVFGALVFKLSVWCGAEGYVSGLRGFGHHYSQHQELESIIQVVGACGIWFSSCRYGVELRVTCAVCGQLANRTHNHTDNLKTKAPNTTGSKDLYNTLELLMMDIVAPETC